MSDPSCLPASSDLDDLKKFYMLGASSYHVKPVSASDLKNQLSVINAYWLTSEVPEVDSTEKQLPTNIQGRPSERFPQPGEMG